jgi:DNA-directed RNA polymerase specialized sigma24 family protein
LSVRARRGRHEQFQRERAVVRLRDAVLAAVAPAFVARVGSSAVCEAVDEALAQLVAAGGHLAEPDEVKALWITCARRRLIDEQRSAESRYRDVAAPVGDEAGWSPAGHGWGEPTRLTEDERQWWRIREILSVLRNDQRIWAEAWYDRVLSASRVSGGQPRGLAEALGWSPAKTKSVSRRARMRMAAFIDDRMRGAVCAEQRGLMDALIVAGRQGRDTGLDERCYENVLTHVAGCEDCWEAWHARRRALLGRCRAVLAVPIDIVAVAAHTLAAKFFGLAVETHMQAQELPVRVGIGGAAAAGGGAATIGAKATAVCVGLACATTGGELAGVLPVISLEPVTEVRSSAARAKRAVTTSSKAARRDASRVASAVAPVVPVAPVAPVPPAVLVAPVALVAKPEPAGRAASAAHEVRAAPPAPVFRPRAGDAPPASATRTSAGSSSAAPSTPPAASSSFQATSPAERGSSFAATGSESPDRRPVPLLSSGSRCVPGSWGC